MNDSLIKLYLINTLLQPFFQWGADYFLPQPSFTIDPEIAKANAEAIARAINATAPGIINVTKEVINEIVEESAKASSKYWVPTLFVGGLVTVGLPLIYRYAQSVLLHNIGKPSMALKQHKITYLNQFTNAIKQKLIEYEFIDPEDLAKPIFKKEIEDQIQGIVKSTINIKRNNSFFQNLFLYGPGGTGKTMIAEKILKETGMNFIIMSGGALGPFIKRGEHVSELNKLLDAAEKSSTPTIIFIDEAEGLCKNRKDLDQERLELQNTLLNRTGTPSKKIMLILATNRLEDIDKAILNRMTHKIHIGLPGLEERTQIIEMYVNQFFKDIEERNEFFNEEKIQGLGQKTTNLSGRSLFWIINRIFASKGDTDENRLTHQIVDHSFDQFLQQERDLIVPD